MTACALPFLASSTYSRTAPLVAPQTHQAIEQKAVSFTQNFAKPLTPLTEDIFGSSYDTEQKTQRDGVMALVSGFIAMMGVTDVLEGFRRKDSKKSPV